MPSTPRDDPRETSNAIPCNTASSASWVPSGTLEDLFALPSDPHLAGDLAPFDRRLRPPR